VYRENGVVEGGRSVGEAGVEGGGDSGDIAREASLAAVGSVGTPSIDVSALSLLSSVRRF
jgi:hypothetical protein